MKAIYALHVMWLPGRVMKRWPDALQWIAKAMPYMYGNPKLKCYRGAVDAARSCVKAVHSCCRKVVSYWWHPQRNLLRIVGKAMSIVVQAKVLSWQVWGLHEAAERVRQQVRKLERSKAECTTCMGVQERDQKISRVRN